MSKSRGAIQLHPLGEPQKAIAKQSRGSQALDTYGGKVHLRWDAGAAVTAYGQMPYFIEFLKTAGLSARLPQPQCSGGARRVGHPAAEPAGRTSPLRRTSARFAAMGSTRSCWG